MDRTTVGGTLKAAAGSYQNTCCLDWEAISSGAILMYGVTGVPGLRDEAWTDLALVHASCHLKSHLYCFEE